jgi:hypothetical protein
MKMMLFLMMGLLVGDLQAQDNWIVYLNKQPVLDATEESREKNIVSIKASSLRSKNIFMLTYLEAEKQQGWSRSLMIFDSSDHELKRIKGSRLSLTNNSLLSMLRKSRRIDIYTVSMPDDPAIRERIRVRRVHLCTLVLQ